MGRKIDFSGKLYTYIAYRSIDCIFLVISLSFISNFPHIAEDSLHLRDNPPRFQFSFENDYTKLFGATNEISEKMPKYGRFKV